MPRRSMNREEEFMKTAGQACRSAPSVGRSPLRAFNRMCYHLPPYPGGCMLARKRIAVIGAGKLGETLIKALLEAKVVHAEQIHATTRHLETSERKGKLHGIKTSTDNAAAAKGADIVILSVKPQVMAEALASIRKVVTKDQIIISTAASVSTAFIERGLGGGVPVIRTMPNTP